MRKSLLTDIKFGIIAGGQLSKMLIQEASKWDIKTYVLDSDEECPARDICSFFVKGDRGNYNDVYNFGKTVDIITFEIESINTDALFKLKEEGLKINPDPFVLTLIQDKGLQKEFYRNHNIPTANFLIFEDKAKIIKAVSENLIKFPFVQKLRKGGYDGRGVVVINSEAELHLLMNGSSVIEEKVDILKEISVITARNENGECRVYPVVEMVFDEKANILNMLICPAEIEKDIEDKAYKVAIDLTSKLNMVGLLAVEMFIDKNYNLIVNEIAPRPHNSGHHTIENNLTSQFEQHLRAVLNLPLGETKLKYPAVMLNLLGEDGYYGKVKYIGVEEALSIEGVKIHIYGKKITKPFRKMGHVTIISDNLKEAIEKAYKVKKLIRVIS